MTDPAPRRSHFAEAEDVLDRLANVPNRTPEVAVGMGILHALLSLVEIVEVAVAVPPAEPPAVPFEQTKEGWMDD